MTEKSKLYLKIKNLDKHWCSEEYPKLEKVVCEEDFSNDKMYIKLSDIIEVFSE